MISSELEQFFPYKIARAGQDELIEDIDLAFRKKKVLLAHAPTGLGKTASALSVALYHALREDKKIFFLTNRHTQHQIVINTLRLVQEKTKQEFGCVDLIGKRWMCAQKIAGLFSSEFNEFCKYIVEKGECEFYNNLREKKELSVEGKNFIRELNKLGPLHNEELKLRSNEQKMCSYEVSIELAKKAKVIIGDYYYLFHPFIQNTFFNKLNLEMEKIILIVDEGHNLPSRITEMLSNNLTSNMLKNAIMEAKKFDYKGLIIWLQEIMCILNKMADFSKNFFPKEKLVTQNDFVQAIKLIIDYDELINELESAAEEIRRKQRKSYLGGISFFLEAWKGEDKGFARLIAEKEGKFGTLIVLSYTCLDPSIATKEVFANVHAAVIMSGTLKPLLMYKDVLGIKESLEKEYLSPFPLENRLALIVPETSTKYDSRGMAMYQQIAEKCSEISSLIPGNVAFFFPSYALRDQVANFFTSGKKILWEKSNLTKEEKELLLQEFKELKDEGAVLLAVTGANFAEGVDFKGDFLNGVVIVGLPLARPDLTTKEIIKYYDEKFAHGWDYGYTFPAMNKCFQSAGRCIRSEKDKGAIIYLDARFAWPCYFACFSREGLIVSKNYAKLLKEFFNVKTNF